MPQRVSVFTTIEQQSVAIIQRSGKPHNIAGPGFHWRMPIADQIGARLDLRILEMTARVESKTQDCVFVHTSIAAQYTLKHPHDVYYKRSSAQKDVLGVVRARVPNPQAR